MKVLLFGANGNLGQDLRLAFERAGHRVREGDWRTPIVPADNAPAVIVNAVAYNDVDGAENPANAELVQALNVDVPSQLAKAARQAGAMFVHYSTDYVFDGRKVEGYKEDDLPSPLSVYGQSKFKGEEAVRNVGQVYICRLSKLFGRLGTSEHSKPNFLTTMIRLSHEKPELSIVDEEWGCPTYTADIAAATVALVGGGYPSGTYHLVNEGPGVTLFGFIEEAFGILGIETPRRAVPRGAFPRPAQIPAHAVLLNTKFPKLRSRTEALRAFFDENPSVR